MSDMSQEELNGLLCNAATNGDMEAAAGCLELGADVNAFYNDASVLYHAAAAGDVYMAAFLLAKGANPDQGQSCGFTPLMAAAYYGHREIVHTLMEAGADRFLRYDTKTAAEFAASAGYSELALEIKGYIAETPEQVVSHTPLGDLALMEVFNFESLEKISMIREGKYGSVEAAYKTNFADLADETPLRAAFEEHKRRGGTRTEEEVFPHKINKVNLRKPS